MIYVFKINKNILILSFIFCLVCSAFYIYFCLQPPGINTGNMEFIVVIDPGHGSIDTGTYHGNIYEKEINLQVAMYLKETLSKHNIIPVLTRSEDILYNKSRSDDLKHRPRVAQENNADLFISLHVNNFPSSLPSGSQIFYKPNSPYSKELGVEIKQQLITINPDNDRELKKGDFYVLNHSPCPAVLIEMGFLSNPEDRNKLQDPVYQKKLASAIARGIILYLQNELAASRILLPPPVKQTPGKQKVMQVYYLQENKNGFNLSEKNYSYPTGFFLQNNITNMKNRKIIALTALKQLTDAPGNLTSIFPSDQVFTSLEINKDKAIIHLSAKHISSCNWGAERELLTFLALKKTILSIPGIEKLEIRLDGEKTPTLAGHILFSPTN